MLLIDEIARRLVKDATRFAKQVHVHFRLLPRTDSGGNPHRLSGPMAFPRIARNDKQGFHVKLRKRSVPDMRSLTVANPENTALSSIGMSRRWALYAHANNCAPLAFNARTRLSPTPRTPSSM